MRSSILLLGAVLFKLTFANAQPAAEGRVDSLERVIEASPDDSVKVNLLIELSTAYLESDAQRAIASGDWAEVRGRANPV